MPALPAPQGFLSGGSRRTDDPPSGIPGPPLRGSGSAGGTAERQKKTGKRKRKRGEEEDSMKITDELIGYIGDLSRLYLSEEEKERAKKDLSDILDYTEKLNELDTDGLPEMSHPFDAVNCFRQDVVTNGDDRENLLSNAPERKGSYFKVFKTVE